MRSQPHARPWTRRCALTALSVLTLIAGACGSADADDAQAAADLEAVAARQQDVEHDHVVRELAGAPVTIETVVGDVDVEAFGEQTTPHTVGERHVVLHDEHTHARHCADRKMRAG